MRSLQTVYDGFDEFVHEAEKKAFGYNVVGRVIFALCAGASAALAVSVVGTKILADILAGRESIDEVWINPPADRPELRMLQLPRNTNCKQQLSQTG